MILLGVRGCLFCPWSFRGIKLFPRRTRRATVGIEPGGRNLKSRKVHWVLVVVIVASCAIGCDGDGQGEVCTPFETTCDGIDVVRCSAAGTGWDLLETCLQFCTDGACVTACVPDCDGAQCGDDGCGGICGAYSADNPVSYCTLKCGAEVGSGSGP